MLGRCVCMCMLVCFFLSVYVCLKAKDGLRSLGIAAALCTTILPIFCLILSCVPVYFSYLSMKSTHGLKIQDLNLLFILYIFELIL